MASCRVVVLPSAARELEGLPRAARRTVVDAIDSLARDPRPEGPRLLAGTGEVRLWRIRVGGYRVLYQVEDERVTLVVVRVADRRDAYKQPEIRALLRRLRLRQRR